MPPTGGYWIDSRHLHSTSCATLSQGRGLPAPALLHGSRAGPGILCFAKAAALRLVDAQRSSQARPLCLHHRIPGGEHRQVVGHALSPTLSLTRHLSISR